jgi:hypothetical protein
MPRRIGSLIGERATTGGRHRGGIAPAHSAIIEAEEVAVMKRRVGYKGYVLLARSYEPHDGGFSAEEG